MSWNKSPFFAVIFLLLGSQAFFISCGDGNGNQPNSSKPVAPVKGQVPTPRGGKRGTPSSHDSRQDPSLAHFRGDWKLTGVECDHQKLFPNVQNLGQAQSTLLNVFKKLGWYQLSKDVLSDTWTLKWTRSVSQGEQVVLGALSGSQYLQIWNGQVQLPTEGFSSGKDWPIEMESAIRPWIPLKAKVNFTNTSAENQTPRKASLALNFEAVSLPEIAGICPSKDSNLSLSFQPGGQEKLSEYVRKFQEKRELFFSQLQVLVALVLIGREKDYQTLLWDEATLDSLQKVYLVNDLEMSALDPRQVISIDHEATKDLSRQLMARLNSESAWMKKQNWLTDGDLDALKKQFLSDQRDTLKIRMSQWFDRVNRELELVEAILIPHSPQWEGHLQSWQNFIVSIGGSFQRALIGPSSQFTRLQQASKSSPAFSLKGMQNKVRDGVLGLSQEKQQLVDFFKERQLTLQQQKKFFQLWQRSHCAQLELLSQSFFQQQKAVFEAFLKKYGLGQPAPKDQRLSFLNTVRGLIQAKQKSLLDEAQQEGNKSAGLSLRLQVHWTQFVEPLESFDVEGRNTDAITLEHVRRVFVSVVNGTIWFPDFQRWLALLDGLFQVTAYLFQGIQKELQLVNQQLGKGYQFDPVSCKNPLSAGD